MAKFEEAIHYFDEALDIDEKHVKSLTKRAKSHFYGGYLEDCLIDCKELERICQSEEIKQLYTEAKAAKIKRGDLDTFKILGISRNCKPDEITAAFKEGLEKYDPKSSKNSNKLKAYQQIWRYNLLKARFHQFKSNQNPENDESP